MIMRYFLRLAAGVVHSLLVTSMADWDHPDPFILWQEDNARAHQAVLDEVEQMIQGKWRKLSNSDPQILLISVFTAFFHEQAFLMLPHNHTELPETKPAQMSNYAIAANLNVPGPLMPTNVHNGVSDNPVSMQILMRSDSARKCFIISLDHH